MKTFKLPKDASQIDMASMDLILDNAVDITGAAVVDVSYVKGSDGEYVLWVNVNGICALRICQIKELTVRKV